MCGCFKCAPTCICSCHRPPFSLRTYHLHTETGAVHCDQRALTYSSRDTCPVYPKVPVVVIDPEDRDQVERMIRALSTGQPVIGLDPSNRDMVDAAWLRHAQAALRSLIESPRPDEPTGLGAVARSGDSGALVRVTPSTEPGLWVNSRLPDEVLPWDGISLPLTVLSGGVTP